MIIIVSREKGLRLTSEYYGSQSYDSVCVCVCVCVCLFMCICTHVYMGVRTYVRSYLCVFTYACIYIRMYLRMCIHICMYMCVWMYFHWRILIRRSGLAERYAAALCTPPLDLTCIYIVS